MKIRPEGDKLFYPDGQTDRQTDGRTDGNEEADGQFSQFYDRA
jgi:hypothetical protein